MVARPALHAIDEAKMQFVVASIFLIIVLSLLSSGLRRRLRQSFAVRPWLVFVTPAFLSFAFCSTAWALDALSPPLLGLVVVYTFVPAGYAYAVRSMRAPSWLDFLLILWLWIPIEFAAGAQWVPEAAQPTLHIAASNEPSTICLRG